MEKCPKKLLDQGCTERRRERGERPVEAIHSMLRAAVSLPFVRGIYRFSTSGHREALDACYMASWQLPRPDFHR